nr:BadF/BadG/BcrA/BcrD ATPase family protein [Lysinibacillus timonensis]
MQITTEKTKRWIGIDGGGTKTSCVIGDERGLILAYAAGDASNIQGIAHQKVRATLLHLIEKVMVDSNSTIEQIERINLCLAGADRERDRIIIRNFFKQSVYESKVHITNDAKAAFVAGTWGESGILLIAGTGSIVYAMSKETGQTIRVGGWGYLLGDEGSGFYIGKRALNAVLKAFDKRAPQTLLTDCLLKHFQISDIRDLISIYKDELLVPKIAKLAKYVMEAAKVEDAVAKCILRDSINELIEMVKAGYDQINYQAPLLVLHGGLFLDPYFKELFKSTLSTNLQNMKIVQPELPAVVGAYILSLIDNGQIVNEELKRNVKMTWNEIDHQMK